MVLILKIKTIVRDEKNEGLFKDALNDNEVPRNRCQILNMYAQSRGLVSQLACIKGNCRVPKYTFQEHGKTNITASTK